jgi:cytochrome P450
MCYSTGNIISLSTFGRSIIILNSAKVANDLLDKRSSIYSDRPRLEMAGDLMGYDHSLTLTPYNERFRETRRLMRGALGPGAVHLFEDLQERQCAQFLVRLLHTPEQFLEHIRQ